MFGPYHNRVEGKSSEFRLPSPFSSFTRSMNFPHNREIQCNNYRNSVGYGRTVGFNQSYNVQANGISQGQISNKERFSRKPKEKLNKLRGGYNKGICNAGTRAGSYYCDSCDRGFQSLEDFQNHCRNDHVTCGLDGCTLSAHPKVVEKHQKIQHATGLYLRLMSSSSQNAEDVAKWVAERKKNYPTKENIERRQEEEEERLKRGESLRTERGGFGQFGQSGRGRRRAGRGRGPRGRGNQSESSQIYPSRDRRGRSKVGHGGGIRKKNFCRNSNERNAHLQHTTAPCQEKMDVEDDEPIGIPMFAGTAALLGITIDIHESSDEESEDDGAFSDSEWMLDEERGLDKCIKKEETNGSIDGATTSSPGNHGIALNNALGFLMGTYGSDDSNSDEGNVMAENKPLTNKKVCRRNETESTLRKVTKITQVSSVEELDPKKVSLILEEEPHSGASKMDEESDGSAPEEESIRKEGAVAAAGEREGGPACDEAAERRKRGRRGKKRGRGKVTKETSDGSKKPKEQKVERQRKHPAQHHPRPHCPTLLEELLKNEIRHERNVILQCIRYVIEKNFFDRESTVPSKFVEGQNKSAAEIEQNPIECKDTSEIHPMDNCIKHDIQSIEAPVQEHDVLHDLSSKKDVDSIITEQNPHMAVIEESGPGSTSEINNVELDANPGAASIEESDIHLCVPTVKKIEDVSLNNDGQDLEETRKTISGGDVQSLEGGNIPLPGSYFNDIFEASNCIK